MSNKPSSIISTDYVTSKDEKINLQYDDVLKFSPDFCNMDTLITFSNTVARHLQKGSVYTVDVKVRFKTRHNLDGSLRNEYKS